MKRPNLLAAETLLPPPVQRRSAASRAKWKAAALSVFAARGYEATAVDDIASRAGLAIGGFYQHFQSKRQLLRVLMDDLLAELDATEIRLGSGAGLQQRVARLLIDLFATDLRYLGAYRAWQEAASADAELAADSRRIHRWTTARVQEVFEALHRHPGARRDVDVAAVAALMDAVFWALLAQQARSSRRVQQRALRAAAHLICHALFPDRALAGGRQPHRRTDARRIT